MSRLKQTQSIDSLINSINTVTKNRSSYSDDDLKTLNEVLELLEDLKKKKGKTNKLLLDKAALVVELLSKYLL